MKFRLIFLSLFLLMRCVFAQNLASLVVKNARIWTGNPTQKWAEAIAISGDKIAFVGSNQLVKKYIDANTKVIDAQGQMLTPGFIDCHVHFIWGGFDLANVQLRDANTKELFVNRIADFAKTLPAGTWILSGTWDHTLWGGELPEASWIDAVTPNNPVFISRSDGHMYLANSLAMKLTGISAVTKDVEGGTIIRDKNGNPTGIFKDNASDLIQNAIPPMSDAQNDHALDLATNFYAKNGITSINNMGTWEDLDIFRRAEKQNRLKTRIYANVPLSTWAKLKSTIEQQGKGDDWLKIGGLKGFVDGSLGSHTAKMMQPFSDNNKDKGLYITPLDSLYKYVSNADKANLQIMVHAIGDEAIHQQLNIFERVAKENGQKDRRFRIEHAQHIAPKDISRFKTLKIIPSMQPYHAIDDGRWAEKYLGYERCKTTYAFKSLINSGVKIAFGSDWFVAPPSPMVGIYAAVTRRTLDDKNPNGWIPEQKISVEEALQAYTRNAAFASFDERNRGTLEAGKLADFVLLEKDITKIAAPKIKDVQIMMTVVGGQIVYKNEYK